MSNRESEIPPAEHHPPENPYARSPEGIREPPSGFLPTLKFLGPSFILIGSIVGSGELILTTSMGAHVGFAALWFILLSCVCKTIFQAELGRYTISSGDTCLEAFNRLPGPRGNVNWFMWLWVAWQIPGLINGGGILGGVGQVLATAFPGANEQVWVLVVAAVNVAILLVGRYSFLEVTATATVIIFSVITVFCTVALQMSAHAVPLGEALTGLRIQVAPLVAPAALYWVVSAFAATGVSGGELMSYTYWCVEKGYARYAGVPDGSEAWVARARGWIRVMQIDVWLATVIFTASTIAFFWLGAGILHPKGVEVSDKTMIKTLSMIYTTSLGEWASGLFLLGAFFVLYSTIFSGTAGGSRMYADALCVFKLVDFTDFRRRMRWIRIFTIFIPLMQALSHTVIQAPKSMILFGAVSNGLLIPVLVAGVIWLRYRRTMRQIAPGLGSDILMWICAGIVWTVSVVYLIVDLGSRLNG